MKELQVAIWQKNEVSMATKKILEIGYGPLLEQATGQKIGKISFFSFEGDAAEGVLSYGELCQHYAQGQIHMMIIPIQNYLGQSQLVTESLARGFRLDDFYLAPRLTSGTLTERELYSFLTPLTQSKYLPYLEFHVADHCNLNCKACEHYSGLVHEAHFPKYEKFEQDFRQLHQFIDDIGLLRILGGEPLLNPELTKYIRLAAELYPQTVRYIVTNGLKLLSMEEDFFSAMRETGTKLRMSYYPPVQSKYEEICRKLDQEEIDYQVSDLNTEFTMKQVLQPLETTEQFYHCSQAHCHNLYDGKLAACFLPFTTKYFNAEFDMHLPEDGALDLYEEGMSSERIQRHLFTPFERCKYCISHPVPVKWDVMKTPSELSDWVVLDPADTENL